MKSWQFLDTTHWPSEQLLATLDSATASYNNALAAYEELRRRGVPLQEHNYLMVMERANDEQHANAVRGHFDEFLGDLDANKVAVHTQSPSWEYLTAERLQMHRHVLWAMLHDKRTVRFRKMERHFHAHVRDKNNRARVYESDSLNFLLRMECTFKFTTHAKMDHDAWLGRVHRILYEMRGLKYRTNYSSSHALFHFIMHRPDLRNTSDNTDDRVRRVLFQLMDKYPRPLERNSRRMSLAVSTAASAGRISLAIALLHEAEKHRIPIDAASFAHAVECATDDAKRLEIANAYLRAQEHDWLYDGDDNHSMKNYLLLYAIYDGNFTLIVELLNEMEHCKLTASPNTVRVLFTSFAVYRQELRRQHQAVENTTITEQQKKKRLYQAVTEDNCPTVLHLLNKFPSVLPRTTHVVSQAILQGLRAGDIDEAIAVLRGTRSSPDVTLRPEIFSQVLYALLVSESWKRRDVMTIREIETLFDLHHPNKRHHVYAQLLNLCESTGDLPTVVAVLDAWQENVARPLSHRAVLRVFDVLNKQLKSVEDEGGPGARYAVAGTELSFLHFLDKYPRLFPVDAWTVSNALVRSATVQLMDDVATLLKLAQVKRLTLETAAYQAALEKLYTTEKAGGPTSAVAGVALRACIADMHRNGAWGMLVERDAHFARTVSE